MTITRKFVNWDQPALPTAAQYLCQHYSRQAVLDLDGVVVVMPGSRAGRRLLEILAERAEQSQLVFFPPQITTVGGLPELLYESKRPFASELVQKLAWVEALKSLRDGARPFMAQPPAEDDCLNWMELGALLWRQHRELAADALHFGDVAQQGLELVGFNESARWRFLRQVQLKYLQQLDDLGLWDLQTARLFAIEHGECRTDKDLVLVAAADMNRALRLMLDQVADRVTALVCAPEERQDHFDEHGCLLPGAWADVLLELRPEQWQVSEGPAEQAEAVVRQLVRYAGRYRCDEIAIGVADERLAPQIQRCLTTAGVPSRWVLGRPLSQTGPYRLLAALARFVPGRRYADLAALARHPDVGEHVARRAGRRDWLTPLDRYYGEHLPPFLGSWHKEDRDAPLVQALDQRLREAVAALDVPARKLPAWASSIAQVLQQFYVDRVFDRGLSPDHYTVSALERVRAVLLEHQAAPAAISPTIDAGSAIQLVLQQLSPLQIPPPGGEDAVELLGWLELPLDTSTAVIVTSFNEGFTPKSVNSDLFLPNSLRQQLGLMDNARRYARDAYAVSVLAASRRELTLISARRDTDGNPLSPSRLIFATDEETAARRALTFFRPAETSAVARPWLGASSDAPAESALVIRMPQPLEEPVRSMSVTSFRAYLACPYRFYLRHVLRLEPLDDRAQEMDARLFGEVIHDVLRRFGREQVRDATDADEIARFLRHAAHQCADERFGRRRLPAVAIQLLQIQKRLEAFAAWQARWAALGWRITHSETCGGEEPVQLALSGDDPMTLTGRIDRIDFHEPTRRWAVFDYKTSSQPVEPEPAHRKAGQWIDLQLPLYSLFLPSLGIDPAAASLGYLVLPQDLAKTGERMAPWGGPDLADAEALASDVAERVRAEAFWPPRYPPPDTLGEYAAICQDEVFHRRLEQRQGGGGR